MDRSNAIESRQPGGFSLVEAVAAIVVTGTAAFMFCTGFSSTAVSNDSARTLQWARRLATIQVSIFQRYATGSESVLTGQIRRDDWKIPDGCGNTDFPGGPAPAPHPAPNSPCPTYRLTGSASVSTAPLYVANNAGALHLDVSVNPGCKFNETSPWNVMSTCPPGVGTTSRWLGADLLTARDMGFTVEFYIANLDTTYSRSTATLPVFQVNHPVAVEWYVLEVVVFQYGQRVHSVMLIMG